jgi:hypothetical protein
MRNSVRLAAVYSITGTHATQCAAVIATVYSCYTIISHSFRQNFAHAQQYTGTHATQSPVIHSGRILRMCIVQQQQYPHATHACVRVTILLPTASISPDIHSSRILLNAHA